MNHSLATLAPNRPSRPAPNDTPIGPEPSSTVTRRQRRENHRLDVELDVDLQSDEHVSQGFLENLSRGGLFVATHFVRAVGAKVEFSIHMPEGFAAVRGVGEVRWVREPDEWSDVPPGMGILFVELEASCSQAIARFLAQRQPTFDE